MENVINNKISAEVVRNLQSIKIKNEYQEMIIQEAINIIKNELNYKKGK